MPVADSGGPYVYATFAADTRTLFVSGFKDALVSAGWSAAAVTGGWSLTGTSPQGLSVSVKVWDAGQSFNTHPQVGIQFSSASATGIERRAEVATGFTYQIVCNPCQFFLSRPGIAASVYGSAVCGGVPWVAAVSCSGSTVAETASEAWWASSDYYGNTFFSTINPRVSLLQYDDTGAATSYPAGPRMNEAVWNGHFCQSPQATGNFTTSIGAPEIATITETKNIDLLGTFNSQTLWYGGQPLLYEPLVCWGTSQTDFPVIRAQIWDAIISSKGHPMDATSASELAGSPYNERDWINYTDQYFWGSLWLITGSAAPGPGSSINYIY